MEKRQKEHEERKALSVYEKPEVVIEGLRATSRQLALKEKEVKQKIQENKKQIETKFQTPKKPKNSRP